MDIKKNDLTSSKAIKVMILSVALVFSIIVGAFTSETIIPNSQVEDKVLIKITNANTVKMIKLADSLNSNDLEMIRIYQSHKKAGQVTPEETEFVMNELSENNAIKEQVYRMILDSLNR